MRITAYTDYSLRVLIYLAVNDGKLATIREIAAAYGISQNHLMKLTHQLQLEGFIQTVRGKAGGMRLARAPSAIRIGDIVRAMEPDLSLVECFRPDNQCAITPNCRLKSTLAKALKGFLDVLDQTTLADLAGTKTRAGLRVDLGLHIVQSQG